MNLSDCKPGQIVYRWVYTGTSFSGGRFDTQDIQYAKVLKVGSKKVQIRTENKETGWIYPRFLYPAPDYMVDETILRYFVD